jgi:probable HAF family extracellular repeat protein
MRRRCWPLALRAASMIAALGFLGAAEGAQPQGTPLMITLPPGVLATAVGANGFVVVGNFYSGGSFHWMPTSGVTDIGGRSVAAVSRDGKTIVGNTLDQRGLENAAIWAGDKTWRVLGSVHAAAQPCDQLLSGAFGANDDGKVIVGLAWDGCRFARAFRWEESTGMADLGSLSGESTRANGVSGDGRVVVGWEEHVTGFRQAAKWVDGKEQLIQGPGGLMGEAFAANRDGSMIAGTNCNPLDSTPPAAAWTWTQQDGVKCYPVARPPWAPPRFYQVFMQNMSDDGRVIGGALSFGLDAESVVWFDGEAVFLRDYLRANGIPDAFDGWVNTGFVTGVSADGRTLVGYGAGPTTFTGFMVVLPELGAK